LKISTLPTFELKFPNKIFTWYFRNWLNTCSSSLYELFSVGACKFRKIISHQQPLRVIYDILSLINSTLLTAHTVS
jgi:hypothetical protein